MSHSLKLSPSARDFLIFERLVVENATTRTVATEVGLSQTRVRQIARYVAHWLAETLPTAEADLSEAAQLRLGQHIAADRLERFYVIANRAFEETAQAKYANLCIRILAAQTKLPVITGTLQALAADAIEGPLPDDTSTLYSHPSPPQSEISNLKYEIPPVGACSPNRNNSPSSVETRPTISPATAVAPTPCNNPPSSTRAVRRAFLAPAHPPANDHEAPILELKITPENLGFTTTNKNLSRKERRRHRHLAAKK